MTEERYRQLDKASEGITAEEFKEGWHWCCEWDGLLVGPNMSELHCCSCLPKEHPVYLTTPNEETNLTIGTL